MTSGFETKMPLPQTNLPLDLMQVNFLLPETLDSPFVLQIDPALIAALAEKVEDPAIRAKITAAKPIRFMAKRLRKEIGFVSTVPLRLAAVRRNLQLHRVRST